MHCFIAFYVFCCFRLKTIKLSVSVIRRITDKGLGTTKPSLLSINYRQVDAQQGNFVLHYLSHP